MTDKTPPKDLLDWLGITNAPRWTRSRWLGTATSVFMALLIGGAYLAALGLIYGILFGGKEAGFGTGTVIVALLGAPFLVWSTLIKQETVKYQKEGHITERISKAVEQLGAEKTVKRDGGEVTVPNIEVRIGGLLSLERIAHDSTRNDKSRDHVRVMEILCAYVRENAPASEARDFPLPEWEPLPHDATDEARAAHDAWRKTRFRDPTDPFAKPNARDWAQSLPGPRADIALALQIIGRRTAEQRAVEARWGKDAAPDATWVFHKTCPSLSDTPADDALSTEALEAYRADLQEWKDHIGSYRGYRLDLRGANLQRADLSGAILSGARLSSARLEAAVLDKARLEGADLSEARIEGAIIREARLEGGNLSGARMEGTHLFGARMEGALLIEARMEGANVVEARIQGADLESASLEGANLTRARMEGAWLQYARLEGATLDKARMEGAWLEDARMEGAYLSDARCSTATSFVDSALQIAALREFDISILDLTQEQINATFGDASVTLPDGVTQPAHWPNWKLPFLDDHTFPNFHDEWRKWQADPETYTPPPPGG